MREWLGNEVSLRRSEELPAAIDELRGKKVRIDPSTASAWYFERLRAAGAEIVRGQDPVMLPRACKNAAEIEGSRKAHRRDGAAVARFLHWVASEGQSGKVQEIEACQKLEGFRQGTGMLKDLSFELHFRRRPERGDRPLSRHQPHQSQTRARFAVPDR